MLVRVTIVLLLFLAFASDGDAAGPLPPDAQRFLDERFRGWRFASVHAALQAKLPADSSPEWIEGDYDGDGKTDYAVQIVIAGPPESQQIVLVLLRRGDGYELHTLTSFPVQAAAYLRTSPKGEETMNVDKGTKFVNPTDAVGVLYGEEAGETFVYEKGRFRGVISGD
jgi:hypothetical protein